MTNVVSFENGYYVMNFTNWKDEFVPYTAEGCPNPHKYQALDHYPGVVFDTRYQFSEPEDMPTSVFDKICETQKMPVEAILQLHAMCGRYHRPGGTADGWRKALWFVGDSRLAKSKLAGAIINRFPFNRRALIGNTSDARFVLGKQTDCHVVFLDDFKPTAKVDSGQMNGIISNDAMVAEAKNKDQVNIERWGPGVVGTTNWPEVPFMKAAGGAGATRFLAAHFMWKPEWREAERLAALKEARNDELKRLKEEGIIDVLTPEMLEADYIAPEVYFKDIPEPELVESLRQEWGVSIAKGFRMYRRLYKQWSDPQHPWFGREILDVFHPYFREVVASLEAKRNMLARFLTDPQRIELDKKLRIPLDVLKKRFKAYCEDVLVNEKIKWPSDAESIFTTLGLRVENFKFNPGTYPDTRRKTGYEGKTYGTTVKAVIGCDMALIE